MIKVGELQLNCGICNESVPVAILAGLERQEDGRTYVVTGQDNADLWLHYFVNHPEDCE